MTSLIDQMKIRMAQNLAKLARRLNRREQTKNHLPALLLMTDSERLPDPAPYIPFLPKGSAIIIRAKQTTEKIKQIKALKQACKKQRVLILVSDSPKLALRYRLDGVHFSEKKLLSMGPKENRPNWLTTCAIHNLKSLKAAEKLNITAGLVSPCFATQSHPGQKSLFLWQRKRLMASPKVRFYALGGVNKRTGALLYGEKIVGFAGISSLLSP